MPTCHIVAKVPTGDNTTVITTVMDHMDMDMAVEVATVAMAATAAMVATVAMEATVDMADMVMEVDMVDME